MKHWLRPGDVLSGAADGLRHPELPALSVCDGESADNSAELSPPTSGVLVSLRELQQKLHRICSRNVPEMRDHDVLGRVYRTPPKEADDLKKISGIADVWEEKLHHLGIYTYRQIMEWRTEAISEASRLLIAMIASSGITGSARLDACTIEPIERRERRTRDCEYEQRCKPDFEPGWMGPRR